MKKNKMTTEITRLDEAIRKTWADVEQGWNEVKKQARKTG